MSDSSNGNLSLRVSVSLSKPVAEAPIALNPFVYSWSNKTRARKFYAYLKYILGIVIVPVKVVISIILFSACILLGIVAYRLGPKSSEPPSKLQKAFLWPIRLSARLMLLCLGFYWIKTKGKPATGKEAPIVVSNHVHLWEVLYLFSVFAPSAVSRKENAAIPGFGQVLRLTRGILVDRMSPTSRADVLAAIKERGTLASQDERWPQILIFPEGTTTNGKVVCTFKVGAFAAGLPVQPVAVKYPWQFYDPCWSIDGPGMLSAMIRMYCQFYNRMEVTYLPVYHPSDEEKANPKMYARNVRDLIARELGLPGSNHSAEDALLQVQALKHRIPLDQFNTDMATMHDLLNLDFEGARELLTRFGSAHTTGQVDFDAFCKYLNLPPTEDVEALFNAFDSEQQGRIDLRGLVLGLSSLNAKDANPHHVIEQAWQAFDHKRVGYLTSADLVSVLQTLFPTIKKDDIDALFKLADSNKDGKLTWDEFDLFWRRHPEYVAIAKSKFAQHASPSSSPVTSLRSESSDPIDTSSTHSDKVKVD